MLKKLARLVLAPLALLGVLPRLANSHCPLCIGAVGGAVTAASILGFNPAVVGVFVGGFSIVSGQWLANMVKKTYVPFQSALLTLGSFATMVVPSMAFAPRELFVPVLLAGPAGSVLNQVYWVNYLLIGAVAGAAMVFLADWLHLQVKKKFGLLFPFQGVATIVVLLSLTAVMAQFVF